MLDWDAFRIILAIANEGSLSAAARKLKINQATVSRHLNRAETVLGAKMFDRMNNGLFPTEAGETAINHAREIERQVEEVNRSLIGSDQSLSGSIRLSLPLNLMAFGCSQYIAEFQELYPDISFSINATDEVTNFSSRTVDVVIRADNQPPNGLWGYRITTVNYSFVASSEYVARWEDQIRNDPANVPLPYIALNTSDPKGDEEQLLAEFPKAVKIIECNGLDSVIPLVQTGVGAARIARFMMPTFPNLRKIIDCQDQWDRMLWILTRPDFRETRRIRLFMDFIRDRFKNSQA